jgi:hypothetical protein
MDHSRQEALSAHPPAVLDPPDKIVSSDQNRTQALKGSDSGLVGQISGVNELVLDPNPNAESSIQESATRAVHCYTRLESLLDQLESRVDKLNRAAESWTDSSESDYQTDREFEEQEYPGLLPSIQTISDDKTDNKCRETIPRVLPEVKECDWEHFVNRFSSSDDIYAIEILLGSPNLDREIAHENQRRKQNYTSPGTYISHRMPKTAVDSRYIQKVRIQSPALLEIFSRVTSCDWAYGVNKPHTFEPPFAYFVHFYEQFKEELRRMKSLKVPSAVKNSTNENREDKILDAMNETANNSSTEMPQDTDDIFDRANSTSPPGLDDLQCYVDFVEHRILPLVNRFQGSDPGMPPKIRFDDLWYLFRPGKLLYIPLETLSGLVSKLSHVHRMVPATSDTSMSQKIWRIIEARNLRDNGNLVFQVISFYIDYNGSSYGAVSFPININYFEGDMKVSDLKCYPFHFLSNHQDLLREHREYGAKYVEALSRRHLTYEGWTFVTKPTGLPLVTRVASFDGRDKQKMPEHLDEDVIVDFQQAFNSDPQQMDNFVDYPLSPVRIYGCGTTGTGPPIMVWDNIKRSSLVHKRQQILVTDHERYLRERERLIAGCPYLRRTTWPKTPPQGDDLALLPPRVFVYGLRKRIFCPVNVQCLKAARVSRDPFRFLQLPDDHKRMIRAAIDSHMKIRNIDRIAQSKQGEKLETQDFIRGKGSGLLILLHGEPGVGKTATAEAVAQSTGRPLFSIPCGTLGGPGPPGYGIDNILTEIFRLAHLWDCILLMDEADVLLSARSGQNVLNSSVSSK